MQSIHIEIREEGLRATITDGEGEHQSFPISRDTVKRLCAALLKESGAHPGKNPFAYATLWSMVNAADGRKPK